MSLEAVEIEIEVRDLLNFLAYLYEIGFDLIQASERHMADGTKVVEFYLYLLDEEVGKIIARFIDSYYPIFVNLSRDMSGMSKWDKEKGCEVWESGYWAVPIEPVRVLLNGDTDAVEELLELLDIYEDDYPNDVALKVLELYYQRHPVSN